MRIDTVLKGNTPVPLDRGRQVFRSRSLHNSQVSTSPSLAGTKQCKLHNNGVTFRVTQTTFSNLFNIVASRNNPPWPAIFQQIRFSTSKCCINVKLQMSNTQMNTFVYYYLLKYNSLVIIILESKL
ncbi:Hypothetical_protein [Hexamita inflata]|uniref:Hypothetical_protein n=1 Tax=Hexamita inflata TaxID=28002 RepID=A0AA86QWJ6_9EUKA|nr:Hypothetical protein HINF_LOCUS55024 [Hexamita inflata]